MSESDRRNDNEKETNDPGFRVVDRRRVGRDTTDGTPDSPSATEANASSGASQDDESAESAAGTEAGSRSETASSPPKPPPVEFSTFILSFASTAMIQLGAAPHPDTGETRESPELARETIDLLGMLREKTRGNLTDDESRLFDALLHDLRLKYVEVSSRK